MAIYCVVASQRDLESNLNTSESDSSNDEHIIQSENNVAAVHAPTVVAISDSCSSSTLPPQRYGRRQHFCNVHHSQQNSPSAVYNHHRNCSRANFQENVSPITTSPADPPANAAPSPEIEAGKLRWWVFPQLSVGGGVNRSRTAELGYRVLWSIISDFLPWIIGSYIIFQAFKNGMLELGLAAFLVMLSVHGVIKWCNARGRDKRDEDLEDTEAGAQVDSHCSEHYHHHHNHELSDSDFTSSDDSDTDESPRPIGKVVIVIDEPPPSYDIASKATTQDVELDLQVHLTPPNPQTGSDRAIQSGNYGEGETSQESLRITRPPLYSYTSCLSSEMEDDSLPSYSDAVKKIKRKKKKSSRSHARRTERQVDNGCTTEGDALMHSLDCKDLATTGNTHSAAAADEAPSSDQPNTSDALDRYLDCASVHHETSQDNATNNPPTRSIRVNTSETNSLLDSETTRASFDT